MEIRSNGTQGPHDLLVLINEGALRKGSKAAPSVLVARANLPNERVQVFLKKIRFEGFGKALKEIVCFFHGVDKANKPTALSDLKRAQGFAFQHLLQCAHIQGAPLLSLLVVPIHLDPPGWCLDSQ